MNDNMYAREICPHCKTWQYVWLGNWKLSTDAAECCSCGKFFLMGGKEFHKEILYEIIQMNCNLIDDEGEAATKMCDSLLNGEYIDDPEFGRLDLSSFLEKYATTTKGKNN